MNEIYGGLVSTPRNRMDDSRNIAVTRTFNGTVKESLSIPEEYEAPLPGNMIKYTAAQKLEEVNSYSGGGVFLSRFNVLTTSHTFKDGVGIITFEEDISEIASYSFYKCNSLTSIIIPNSVTSIGNGAFYNCFQLTDVTIGNSVTSIGDNAFQGCSGLTSITIPNRVTTIGESAFKGCTGLTSITLSDGVTNIRSYAFEGCSSLIQIVINSESFDLGERVFKDCSSLKHVIIYANPKPGGGSVSILFEGASPDFIIYVQSELVDNYKHDSGWHIYADRIQAIPEEQ